MNHYCEHAVAYCSESDEDPHPCGNPAVIKLNGEWVCTECYDVTIKEPE